MEPSATSTALVQGASRGLGLAFVEALLGDERYGQVIAASRRPGDSPELSALLERHGGRLKLAAMDVTDEAGIAAAADALAPHCEPLGLLLNCAGVLHEDGAVPEKRLADVSAASLGRAFAVNAAGPLLVAKHFARFLPRRGRSVVANLSARVGSIGDNGLGGWYGYRASKAAQNMMTRTLAIELGRRHRDLVCVALHPGTVDTSLSRPFQRNVPDEKLFTPARAARQLLEVLDGLGPADSGGFFAWDGAAIPW